MPLNPSRKKLFIITSGLILASGLAFLAAPAQSPAPGAAPKLAEQQFKNIQTLKGIPADQLIPAMQFISASLGVECEYCHVERANEKDDKKTKRTAREMITMIMAINKNSFDSKREVTCYSCHRGAPEPVSTPLVGDSEPPRRPPDHDAAVPPAPPASQLLAKYLDAIGGADALHKITSRVQKGALVTGEPGAQPVPIEVFAQAPDKRVSVMHRKDADSITAFDGTVGWLTIHTTPPRVRMSTPAENEAARVDADFYLPADLPSFYSKFTAVPGEKIDGHDTWLVVGRSEGKPPMRLFFDKDSGLLLRQIRYADSPLGRNPTQIDYADYRVADGVKIPFRWTIARPGNRFTIQIDQTQQNVPIDPANFTPPAPAQPGTRP